MRASLLGRGQAVGLRVDDADEHLALEAGDRTMKNSSGYWRIIDRKPDRSISG